MGALRALVEGAGADGLAEIIRAMCDDFRGMRDGFPDLIHVRDGSVSFVEVMAEGDAIRRNQRHTGRDRPRGLSVRPGSGLRGRRHRDHGSLVVR
ncbi:VRR-NUC domain-containing protein [Bradyrhizobium japonicum]|uniref:VRR-NUC domain-containing protein n=1 Tax=Bradyrhizobium japonicum TaxID=375 RepID=UPI002012599D|nr:VRR-NUC domain-containing protein [Bradyrhizobium japonicum]